MRKTNKRIWLILYLFVVVPIITQAYVPLKTWVTYEVLTSTDLNSNFDELNDGLDSLSTAIRDTVKTVVDDSGFAYKATLRDSVKAVIDDSGFAYKATLRDSVKAVIDDSGFMYKATVPDSIAAGFTRDVTRLKNADANDTINNRLNTSVPLFWVNAYAESTYANDSLTVEIRKTTPIGTTQGLYVRNSRGVTEKIVVFLEGILNNAISRLDSISVPLWTETTNGTDYMGFSVWDDSTDNYNWKSKMTTAAPDSFSAAPRTTKIASITGINITGGKFRLKGIINIKSDSMFAGMPIYYVTNP